MAKITRQTQTIFGGTGVVSDFGEFGSLAASTPTTTKNIATIQSLPAWLAGWAAATIGNLIPAYQDMNSVHYCAFYQICYLLQMGISEYDVGTTYYINSVVQFNGVWYKSLSDGNINNEPDISPTNWVCVSSSSFGGNVASTSSMNLPNLGNSFKITGTTTINNITSQPAGIIVSLVFTSSLTVATGGNILLNGGSFNTNANSTLVLLSDGTNWFELSRNPSYSAFSNQRSVAGSRSLGTPFQNTTGKTISVTVSLQGGAANTVAQTYSDSSSSPTTEVATAQFYNSSAIICFSFMVLSGNYYEVETPSGGASIVSWTEWY